MSYYTESNGKPKGKPGRPAGLYIHAYAMDELRAGRIIARQAFLLGHVDRFVNPYKSSRGEGREPVKFVVFTMGQLRKMLGTKRNQTINELIDDLCDFRRQGILKARKMDRTKWRLRTKNREPAKEHGFTIPASIRKPFEDRHPFKVRKESEDRMTFERRNGKPLTPMEVMILSQIVPFTSKGKPCYLSGFSLGKPLGIKEERVKDLVNALVDRGCLEKEIVTHKELRKYLWVDGHIKHDDKFDQFKRRGRCSRLLTPTLSPPVNVDEDDEWPDDEDDIDV